LQASSKSLYDSSQQIFLSHYRPEYDGGGLPKCNNCGTENEPGAMFCGKCGVDQRTQPTVTKKSKSKMIIGIVAVVIVVILIIAALGVLSNRPGGSIFGNSATIVIVVHSNHMLFAVDYNLYVDGDLYQTGNLEANYYIQYTLTHNFMGSTDTLNVYANAVGGGMGQTSDTDTVTLYPNQSAQIDLYI
jgi:hypothetical protein